jgi:hypothetical protein
MISDFQQEYLKGKKDASGGEHQNPVRVGASSNANALRLSSDVSLELFTVTLLCTEAPNKTAETELSSASAMSICLL